jgi:hypothetical protein
MIRAAIVVVSITSLLTGIAFSTGNPSDVESDAGTEGTADAATEEDAPIVDGVFNEEEPVEETDSKSAKVDRFYNGLTSENIGSRMDAMYATSVQFSSPFTTLSGKEALLDHYRQLYADLTSFELEITEEFVSGQETVLLWEISFASPKLKGGEKLKVSGVSHLTFANDQVVSQKDYYDAGAVVYEHVTLVGRLVKWVKHRVAGS